ncbi:MAG TPA: SDR family oxidoreductase [Thermoleophilia bacterium]|nr:SDR family oxidoreductase [Thermoleophilia bacterium]
MVAAARHSAVMLRSSGAGGGTLQSAGRLLSMKGRRVLVTGAASGIGAAIAARFAEAGADLIIVDLDLPGLQAVAESVSRPGCVVALHELDLTRKKQIATLWEGLDAALPDTLVNNAGSYPLRDFLEITPAFLERSFALNLKAVLWMCQEFIRRRLDKGGVIVNDSSIEAIVPFRPDLVPYGTAKAGVIALTRSLARDHGKRGFRVNVLLPGAIRTPGTEALVKMAVRRVRLDLMKTGYGFQSRLPLGKWGRPDDVARMALVLASEAASYVQGAAIPVDGGFLSA